MELLKNISEYYEELFPITQQQRAFYQSIVDEFKRPVKFLRINCGTGSFEHKLSQDGHDVTAIEECQELLECANRRRRTQLMFLRYFSMSTLEMGRFLGKGFYDVISILENRISFIHDATLLKKFFFDCRNMIAEGGRLIVKLYNYAKYCHDKETLPEKESIRTQLVSWIDAGSNGEKVFNQEIKIGNGKKLCVTENARIFPLTANQIQELACGAGFKSVEFYGDFDLSPLNDESDEVLAVIR